MSAKLPVSKNIVVDGDVTIDWNLIYFQDALDTTSLWNASNTARACPLPGGAAMLSELIETLCAGLTDTLPIQIFAPRLPENVISSGNRCFNHSYAIWGLLGDKDKKGWRVSQYLGIDPASTDADRRWGEDTDTADLIVLDDANLGFRGHPSRWPKALQNPESKAWIVLKLCRFRIEILEIGNLGGIDRR